MSSLRDVERQRARPSDRLVRRVPRVGGQAIAADSEIAGDDALDRAARAGEDIDGSRAWVQALFRADVLTREEAQTLDRGLLAVQARFAAQFPHDAPDEDIHSLVERVLYEEVGDVAGKLHTGRSRNDQVITDSRLWTMRAGAKVVMLEAGPWWDSAKDSVMLKWPYESPRRGAASAKQPFGEFDGCIGGWTLEGEPYTVAEGESFLWWRARMLGGRTNHWGRISLRFGPDDFRSKTIDGLGDDWPIGYDDLKPYYDRLDRLVGLHCMKLRVGVIDLLRQLAVAAVELHVVARRERRPDDRRIFGLQHTAQLLHGIGNNTERLCLWRRVFAVITAACRQKRRAGESTSGEGEAAPP